MIITLSVKDGPGAETTALGKLNAWFTEGGHDAPFPPGTLLHYAVRHENVPGPWETKDPGEDWATRCTPEDPCPLRAAGGGLACSHA